MAGANILIIGVVIVFILYLVMHYDSLMTSYKVGQASSACNKANISGSSIDYAAATTAIKDATFFITSKTAPYNGVNVPKYLTDGLSTINNLNCVVLYGTLTPNSIIGTGEYITDTTITPTVNHVYQAINNIQIALNSGAVVDVQKANDAISFAQVLLNNTISAYRTANIRVPDDLINIQKSFAQLVLKFKNDTIAASAKAADKAATNAQTSIASTVSSIDTTKGIINQLSNNKAAFIAYKRHRMGFAATPINIASNPLSEQANINLKVAVAKITTTLTEIQTAIDLCNKVIGYYTSYNIEPDDVIYPNIMAKRKNLTDAQTMFTTTLSQMGSLAVIVSIQKDIAKKTCDSAMVSGASADYQSAVRLINGIYTLIATGKADASTSTADNAILTASETALDNMTCTILYGTGTGKLPTSMPTKEDMSMPLSPSITPANTIYNTVQAALNAKAYATKATETGAQKDLDNAIAAYTLADLLVKNTISSLNGLTVGKVPDDLTIAKDTVGVSNQLNNLTQIKISNNNAIASYNTATVSIANAINLISSASLDLAQISSAFRINLSPGIYYKDSAGAVFNVQLPALLTNAVMITSTTVPISYIGISGTGVPYTAANIGPSATALLYNDPTNPITVVAFTPMPKYKFRNVVGPKATDLGWCLRNTKSSATFEQRVNDNSTWIQDLNCELSKWSEGAYAVIPLPASMTNPTNSNSVIPAGAFILGDYITGLFLVAATYNNITAWSPIAKNWNNLTGLTNAALAQFAWVADAANTDADSPLILRSIAFPGMCFTYDRVRGHIEKCTGAMGATSGQALVFTNDLTNFYGASRFGK